MQAQRIFEERMSVGGAPVVRAMRCEAPKQLTHASLSQHLTSMSRGLGRIERAILGLIEDEGACEYRYTAHDLALAIYQPKWPSRRPTLAEHVAALRAMHSLVRKFPDRLVLTGGEGREPLRVGRR